jgi:hypothetical protein
MDKPIVHKCRIEDIEAMEAAGIDDEVERQGYVRRGNLLIMDREAKRKPQEEHGALGTSL